MGYYSEYFSTLLKGIRVTALKERIEVRRAINSIRKADHILYKSLWSEVEKEHRVTKALKDESKLIKQLKKSSDNSYSLVFNLSTEDQQLLKAVEEILKKLETFSTSKEMSDASSRSLVKNIALTVFAALKKAESEEREEFKQVMTIIEEAEEKNKNKFMANVRLAFQKEKQQTLLAKFAARAEIRKVKVNILKLQQVPHKIDKFIQTNRRQAGILIAPVGQGSRNRLIEEMYKIEREIKFACNEAFTEMFYIKKRVSLLTLKILLDLNNLREYNGKWVEKHFMPQQPVEEKNKEIDKIENKISSEFHTIAQAFRIIITKIQKLEKEAQVDAS